MFKTSLLFLISGLTCLIFSSSVSNIPTDPAVYSKKLVDVLKKNNQDLFVQAFELTDADLDYLTKEYLSSPYLTENEKERFQNEFENKNEIKEKLKERLVKSFNSLKEWIQTDSINVNHIEHLVFYYDMEFEKRTPMHVIDNGSLYIKHGTKFYKIQLNDIIFINNQWKYGEVDGIEEVDQHLNYVSNYGYDDYATDSVAVVEPAYEIEAYAYDTAAVAVVDTAYYYDPAYYPEYTDKQTKKLFKIQKKIDMLYEKKDKIYGY